MRRRAVHLSLWKRSKSSIWGEGLSASAARESLRGTVKALTRSRCAPEPAPASEPGTSPRGRGWAPLFAAVFIISPALAQDVPSLTGRVVDAAGILSPETEAALDLRLSDWESESSDQIVVATIPTLGGTDIADYGPRLGRAWGIGQGEDADGRRLDNGAILIIAPNERQVRVEVGYGLEGTLTDAAASRIVRSMVPALREGDYDRAATEGVAAMIGVLSGDLEEARDRRRRAPDRPMATGAGEGGFPWPLLLFGAFFLLSFWPRRRRRGRVLFDSDPRARRLSEDLATAIILGQMAGGRRGGFSGGGFSSGGFSGGFSGGGGSFGGGGASASW